MSQLVDASKPSKAFALSDSLLQIIKKNKLEDCTHSLWIRYERGEALELMADRSEDALQLYYDLSVEVKQKKEWELLAEIYISIARVHETIGRGKDCKRYLNLAIGIIEAFNLNSVYSRYAVRNSSYHRIYENRDSAQFFALQAIQYGKDYDVQRSYLDGYLLMGILTEDPRESIKYFEEATLICEERNDYYGAISMKLNIVQNLMAIGDYEEAMWQVRRMGRYFDLMPQDVKRHYSKLSRYYEMKSEIYEKLGFMDSAYYSMRESRQWIQQATFEINQEKINQKETEYAVELEKAKLKLEKEQTKSFKRIIAVLGVLSLILIGLFINNESKRRRITKQNELIASQNEKLNKSLAYQNILMSEIHHRVKNNLQVIISLLALKGMKSSDENLKSHLDDISNKIHGIALIHEKLYSGKEFDKINTKEYFRELFNYYSGIQDEDRPFTFSLNIDEISLNLETIMPIGIICSELISNSLKYAFSKGRDLHLELSVTVEGGYYFSFKDNGPGYPAEKVSNPNGIGEILINSMVRQLNAKSKKYNKQGAVFEMEFVRKNVSKVH